MTKEQIKALEQELIPCPWCGKKPKLRRGAYWWIRCDNSKCPISPETRYTYHSPEEAVKIWNSMKIPNDMWV